MESIVSGESGRVAFRRETGVEGIDRDGERAADIPPPHLAKQALLTGKVKQADSVEKYDLVLLQWSRIQERRSGFNAGNWILSPEPACGPADNSDTPEKVLEQPFKHPVREYAEAARRWAHYGHLAAVIAPDLPWLPKVKKKTCMDVAGHQKVTLEAYLELAALMEDPSFGEPFPPHRDSPPYVIPVLTGNNSEEYISHLRDYEREIPGGLPPGAWVSLGKSSLRDRHPTSAANIMLDVLKYRKDLRIHLPNSVKHSLLVNATFKRAYTIDISYSWSHEARRLFLNPNDDDELGAALERRENQSRNLELDFEEDFLG